MDLVENFPGNYRFLTGGRPYSSGVAAMSGYEIVNVRLARPLPYREGFLLADDLLKAHGRPPAALGAIELRSPKSFTQDGFNKFNEEYRVLLVERDLFVGKHNPVARTNVAPEIGAPAEPVMVAFSYTAPSSHARASPDFVVAGAAELVDARIANDAIIRPGETSPDALRDKAEYVVNMMARRVKGLGGSWDDVSVVSVYTVHQLDRLLRSTILTRIPAAAMAGVRWIYARPPIKGLEFEMDVRAVRKEVRLVG